MALTSRRGNLLQPWTCQVHDGLWVPHMLVAAARVMTGPRGRGNQGVGCIPLGAACVPPPTDTNLAAVGLQGRTGTQALPTCPGKSSRHKAKGSCLATP